MESRLVPALAPRLRPFLAVASLALASLPAAGFAESGDACVSSYEGAQSAMREQELVKARAELSLCLGACPGALSSDCQKWLGEVEGKLGRLSLRVETGSEPLPVTVSIDGQQRGDASPYWLTPGAHQVRVSAVGMASEERKLQLAPGETHAEVVVLVARQVPAVKGRSWLGPVVLGSLGGAVLTAAGAVALAGHLDVAAMRDEKTGCAPLCPETRLETVRELWLTSGVLSAVGGAAVLSSVVWGLATSPSDDLGLEPSVGFAEGRPSVGLRLGGRFR